MIKDRQQMPAPLNKAIHEFNSKLEKRIYWVVMNQIKKSFGIEQELFNNKLFFNVPVELLTERNYDRLKEAAIGLANSKIKMINDKDEEFRILTPFPEIEYKKRSGVMRVRLLDSAFPYFAELSKGYYWFALKGALTLSSMYSQRFYELFCETETLQHGTWKNVEVVHLKRLLNIDDSIYKRKANMLVKTIYEPIEEINQKTNLNVTYEPIKEGRNIVAFNFFVKEQQAKGEAGEYAKIEKYFEEFKALPGQEKSNEVLLIKERYNLSEAVYNEVMVNKGLLNEVLGAHQKIKEGKIDIQKSEAHYMGGVIKRFKEKNFMK